MFTSVKHPAAVWEYLARTNCKAVLLDTPHGRFWTTPDDKAIGFFLFIKREFDFLEFARLTQAVTAGLIKLPTDAVFLDVGANIGTHTIYALNSGLFSRAVCIEPDPSNFRLLERNVAENGYAHRCCLRNIALGEALGDAVLELSRDNPGDHRIRRTGLSSEPDLYNETARATVTVKVSTLDNTLSELGVDPSACFLHVDVQPPPASDLADVL